MIIQNNHIKLRTIKKEDIELVRQWRNSNDILRFMEFQEIITVDEQLLWFDEISQSNDYYFMIIYHEQKIGMIHLAPSRSSGAESGLFIGEGSFRNSPVAYWASLPLLDFGFNVLSLESIFAKVNKNNLVARNYNQSLGFEYEEALNENFDAFRLDIAGFENTVSANRAFSKLMGNYTLDWEGDKSVVSDRETMFIF